ncbi:MAG: molybdopterin molybdotransferase MoeA [Proteobacteria bacterium]|nr:molybdopterin molybdotransferase MoeA [Pseudomonadota bacterium]
MKQNSKSALTPIDVALETLTPTLPRIEGQEAVALRAANGRILAQVCIAEISVPPHDNSAMDGYAVHADDVRQPQITLPVTQRIAAGQLGKPLAEGEAARIFTGAPLPPGADAVVIQENCEAIGDDVTILQSVASGDNVRRAGEDVKPGAVLFQPGHRLRAQDVGLLASAGITRIPVRRKLKVALMTTGDELVSPGIDLQPGQIYNSNFYMLSALLESLGAEVLDLGVIADNFEATRKALENAAASADCIISTGGVSVGEEDYVKAAVAAQGHLQIWKLAIKPGKPLACGNVHGTQFFGLPGNPVSAFVTFTLVVRPCLLTMLGCTNPFPQTFMLAAGFECPRSGERQQYLRASLDRDATGTSTLLPYANQSSGVGASLSGADGLAIIPPYTAVAVGDQIEYLPFSELLN